MFSKIYTFIFLCVSTFAFAECPCCQQQTEGKSVYQKDELILEHAYFIAHSGARNASAYVTISNKGDEDDQLESVTFFGKMIPKIELHTHVVDDKGIARMRKIDSFVIPAKGTKNLKPGEDHIMLMNVDKKLSDVPTIDMTFYFKKAGKLTLTFVKKKLSVSCCTGDISAS